MFNKFKDFYKRNRVYSVLMIVSIICIISIFIGIIVYFVGQSTRNAYGNRLEGIKNVEIKESKITELKNKFSLDEKVKTVDIDVRGKLIYIIIKLKSGSHEEATVIAQSGLDNFTKEQKEFYDIQYIIDNESSTDENIFPIMGYISSKESTIKWTNFEM